MADIVSLLGRPRGLHLPQLEISGISHHRISQEPEGHLSQAERNALKKRADQIFDTYAKG